MSLFGALPFVISGDIPSVIDALFESVSGFSTTGASILREVEGLSTGSEKNSCKIKYDKDGIGNVVKKE